MMHLDRETSPQRTLPFVILGRLQNERRGAAAQLAWARQALEPQENLSAAGFKAR